MRPRPVDWTRLTLSQARELRFMLPAAQQHWRALLDAEIVAAVRRNRELLASRKPIDVRARAEAILATLPEEDPEIVMARRAMLLGEEPPALCPCGEEARGGPWCEAHRARVRRTHGDPLLDIPVTTANRGRGPLRKVEAA